VEPSFKGRGKTSKIDWEEVVLAGILENPCGTSRRSHADAFAKKRENSSLKRKGYFGYRRRVQARIHGTDMAANKGHRETVKKSKQATFGKRETRKRKYFEFFFGGAPK